MFYDFAQTVTSPSFVMAALVAVAIFATLYVFAVPYFERGDLQKRMRAVSTEREQIRARERARLNANSGPKTSQKATLRNQDNKSVKNIVERFNLREALVDQNTVNKLRAAGYRSQNALNTFLFARLVLPFIFLIVGAILGICSWQSGNPAIAVAHVCRSRRRLCRVLRAQYLYLQPYRQTPGVYQTVMARCARSDVDLRRIRHIH